jgi:PAS domain S-box-containing protein
VTLPDFRYLVSNKRHDELIGYSNIIGRTISEVLPELEAQGIISVMEEVARTGELFIGTEVKVQFQQPSPRTLYIDFIHQPVRDESGKIYGISSQGYDVTEKVLSRRAVENERENFRRLFKQTPELVCILRGPEHVFEFVNEAHVKVLGFDATGKSVREAQPESVEVYDILDEVYQTGKTAELREIPVTVTDRLRYFNLTYTARRDEAGTINGVMILGVEITEQVLNRRLLEKSEKELYHSQRKMKLALKAAKMGTYHIDLKLNHFSLSTQAEEIFGYTDLTGDLESIVKRVIHPEDLEQTFAKTFAAVEERRFYSDEFRIIRSDGSMVWVHSQGEADYDEDGNPVDFNGVIQDITQRKITERKLSEALRARDEFLSIASHELKTPVTSLKLQLQMASKGVAKNHPSYTPDKLQKVFDSSVKQIDKMVCLVDDLLDVSRINTGQLNFRFESLNLVELLNEIMERFTIQFQLVGCEVDLVIESVPAMIMGDRFRLEQVITNLFNNVIKYGPGKPAVINLKVTDQWAVLSVQDFGMGIEESEQAKIFERFERGDRQNNIGGLGLGLFISKMIVEAHQGTISVASDPGKGSTFIVKLPLSSKD